MQALSQIDNCQKLNSSFPNKNTLIKSSNSKESFSHNIGHFSSSTNYNIHFDFKYVTEAELQTIVKRVRRARQKKQDEAKWLNFIRSKQSEVAEGLSESNGCECCVLGEVNCCTECGFPVPQEQFKDMPRVEEEEVQDGLIASTTSIAENIGHASQLGGVLTKRLQDLVATVGRMTSLLLSSVTTRTAQYEDEDVDRAIKRSVEFDAMFARNHLYEIQRLLKDTKQLVTGKSPRNEIETKISAAIKCVMQAIQVYTKHVSKGARVKYQQVVPIFQNISTIHSLLEQLTGQHVFPFRQELEVSCSYLKQVLLEMSTTDTQSVSAVSRKPARTKPVARHKPSSDLSMYNRRRADWRHKTASLARAKFGPPSGKKHGTGKDPANAKEVPYRNATRAVPEDNVTTMMEMIPNEFQYDESVENPNLVKEMGDNHSKPCSSNSTLAFSLKSHSSQTKSPTRSNPASARSVKDEPTNVQLICLREEEKPKAICQLDGDIQAVNINDTKEISPTTLTIQDEARTEALEYHQKMIEYHRTNSHYKDGKALGIVDRLATRILTEMVMDFQKEEMNNVIQTLYNLEFQ